MATSFWEICDLPTINFTNMFFEDEPIDLAEEEELDHASHPGDELDEILGFDEDY